MTISSKLFAMTDLLSAMAVSFVGGFVIAALEARSNLQEASAIAASSDRYVTAKQTAKATAEISQRIADIQRATEVSVDSMSATDQVIRYVDSNRNTAIGTSASFAGFAPSSTTPCGLL
jgi:nucleoside recognition membrane protein YjiH